MKVSITWTLSGDFLGSSLLLSLMNEKGLRGSLWTTACGLPHGVLQSSEGYQWVELSPAGPQSWKQIRSSFQLPFMAPCVNLKKVFFWTEAAPLSEQREGWISAPILQVCGHPLQPLTLKRKKGCWGGKLCQPHHRNLRDEYPHGPGGVQCPEAWTVN